MTRPPICNGRPPRCCTPMSWRGWPRTDADKPRPKGWKLTPLSVVRFVLGDDDLRIAAKFVGKRSFVERCVVALATNRGLMLIGEPGHRQDRI